MARPSSLVASAPRYLNARLFDSVLHSPHSTYTTALHSTTAQKEEEEAAAMGSQKRALLASLLLAALATQAFVAVSARTGPTDKAAQDDVKKPDCVPSMDPRSWPGHPGTTLPIPSPHGGSPPYHSGSGSGSTPSHSGSGSIPDPSSHGSSGAIPDPSSHGGGAYGGSGTTPAAPWHSSPTPTPAYGGSTPSHSGGHGTATPLVPVDPNSIGTCDYWRTHPMQIWSTLGSWPSSMSHFFGTAGGAVAGGGSGSNVSIQDALASTRTDGTGALMREGAAALLNSMTRSGYPYTTDQVRSAFVAAAAGGSDSAAAAQAAAFKKANEGNKA